VVTIPVVLTFESNCTCMGLTYCSCAAFMIGKLAELYDAMIFKVTGEIISGHTIKHLAIEFGIYGMTVFVENRELIKG